MALEIDSLRTREGYEGRASIREKKVEGGGVKERKDERREKTGGFFYFRRYALVSAWTCFGTSID